MIMFLAVLATAPPVDNTSLSLAGHFENLFCGVCYWCCRVCSGEKKGVYSDREEAERGGNITAINIKKSGVYNYINNIRLR